MLCDETNEQDAGGGQRHEDVHHAARLAQALEEMRVRSLAVREPAGDLDDRASVLAYYLRDLYRMLAHPHEHEVERAACLLRADRSVARVTSSTPWFRHDVDLADAPEMGNDCQSLGDFRLETRLWGINRSGNAHGIE